MKEITLKVETQTDDFELNKIIKLLKAYNKTEIEFTLDFEELEDIIIHYIVKELDINIEDLGIVLDIFNDNNETRIKFDINDMDSNVEVEYLSTELKKHFGSNVLNCDIRKILRIIFIDCCSYNLYNDYIIVSFNANNLLNNWLFQYFNVNK